MNHFTEEQLTDLYHAALHAETAEKHRSEDDGSPQEVYELYDELDKVGGMSHVVRQLIDQLRHHQRSHAKLLEAESKLSTSYVVLRSIIPGALFDASGMDFETMSSKVEDLAREAMKPAPQPKPKFWVSVHGFQSYLRFSEADAIADCNDNGGLYVLPLYAGEPINCKLPEAMCKPADDPETIEVAPLIRCLHALPSHYVTPHVALADVMAIIDALRTGNPLPVLPPVELNTEEPVAWGLINAITGEAHYSECCIGTEDLMREQAIAHNQNAYDLGDTDDLIFAVPLWLHEGATHAKIVELWECHGCGHMHTDQVTSCDCMEDGHDKFTHYRATLARAKR